MTDNTDHRGRSTAGAGNAMEKHPPNQATQKTRKLRWLRLIAPPAVVGLLAGFLVVVTPLVTSTNRQGPNLGLLVIGLFAALVIFSLVVRLGYRYEWTGFGEDVRQKTETQDIRRAKTLWDWLQLLVIPTVLALGGLFFTLAQDERQRAVEEQRAQDAALQSFIDEMGILLVDEDLRDAQSEEARSLARARTLTILERLVPSPEVRRVARAPGKGKGTSEDAAITDPDRRKTIVQFLYESELISKENPLVSLRGANLREAGLRGLSLSNADLSGADLFGAYMGPDDPGGGLGGGQSEGADLSGTNLSGAELSATTLEKADLSGANLSGAVLGSILCDADLSNADLSGADLRRAKTSCITQDQIEQANGDETTLLPDHLQRPKSWSNSADKQPN